jgi:ParB family chromosome partitioning protein
MATAQLKRISVKSIKENPVALRPVNRQSEEYMGLVDSIRAYGVLNSITVRELKGEVNPDGSPVYSLIDGLHRWNASKDAGCEDIPAQVLEKDDADTLVVQVLANIHKVETRPVEYSKQLSRIMSNDPTMTASELAGKLSKSSAWLSERLGLIKLDKKISELVDEGKINLTNAYALAKLPVEEQTNFIDRAMTQAPSEFVPSVHARAKELRDAKRQGRDPQASNTFVPVAHLQKLTTIKGELERPQVGPGLLAKLGINSPSEAWVAAIKWVLHMDDDSVAFAKAKDDERRKKLEDEKAKRQADRQSKKAAEAAEKAAKATG